MSDYFLIRSKLKIENTILNKMTNNLESKFIKQKKNIYTLKSKNYYYHIGTIQEAKKKTIMIKNNLVIILKGSIFNFNFKNKRKKNLLKEIFNEYLKHGVSFIKKLDGSFSITILNLKNDNIYAIRDRHGSSILFYYNKNNKLCLFSKIKFIKKIPIFRLSPNWELIKTYIFRNYRYSYGTKESFFKDVFLFNNNSINHLKKNKFVIKKLYNFKIKNPKNLNLKITKNKFIKLLEESLKVRFKDVKNKSAFLLSGGLDSPTIASIASKINNFQIKTFSIGYKEQNKIKKELFYDETPLIKKIVKHNNLNANFIYPNSKNFLKTFNLMLDIHDEPISSPTWYAHFLLCKKLYNNKVKYVFGGDGGDHILAGLYDDIPYFLADLKFSKNKKLFKKELSDWINLHNHPIYKKNKKIFNIYIKKCFKFNQAGKIYNYTWDEDLMRGKNQYLKILKKGVSFKKINRFPSITKSFLKSKLIQDLHFTSSPPSTRAEIPNFSTFGIECRSVFLDEKVVNFCWNLPITMMIKDGYTKWLIRYSLKDHLPKEVLWNKKHIGLNAPANIWFREGLKNELLLTINNLLNRKNLSIINKKSLYKLMKEHFSNKKDHMMFFWKLYSLEKWLKNWSFN